MLWKYSDRLWKRSVQYVFVSLCCGPEVLIVFDELYPGATPKKSAEISHGQKETNTQGCRSVYSDLVLAIIRKFGSYTNRMATRSLGFLVVCVFRKILRLFSVSIA